MAAGLFVVALARAKSWPLAMPAVLAASGAAAFASSVLWLVVLRLDERLSADRGSVESMLPALRTLASVRVAVAVSALGLALLFIWRSTGTRRWLATPALVWATAAVVNLGVVR